MGERPAVSLVGLVIKAHGIHSDGDLERIIRNTRGVADVVFRPLENHPHSISVTLADMSEGRRASAAEAIRKRAVKRLRETLGHTEQQIVAYYAYLMHFPDHHFTDQDVTALRHVRHARVEEIIGFNGNNFLQVWLRKLLPPTEALSVILVVAAQTEKGFL